MAPLKFEEHIKEKLDKREIQPSARAWDEISSILHTHPEKRQRNFVWYAMAASFTGILIISLFYLNNDRDFNEVAPHVADTENKEETQTISQPFQRDTPSNGSVVTSEKENQTKIFPAEVAQKKDLNDPKSTLLITSEERNPSNKKALASATTEEVINSKIAEVIAKVDELTNHNHTVTDNEIDSLLRQAQRDILRTKLLGEDRTISAMVLLSEVEDELDMSFRDQILESLKNGYFKVRTAVADRNK